MARTGLCSWPCPPRRTARSQPVVPPRSPCRRPGPPSTPSARLGRVRPAPTPVASSRSEPERARSAARACCTRGVDQVGDRGTPPRLGMTLVGGGTSRWTRACTHTAPHGCGRALGPVHQIGARELDPLAAREDVPLRCQGGSDPNNNSPTHSNTTTTPGGGEMATTSTAWRGAARARWRCNLSALGRCRSMTGRADRVRCGDVLRPAPPNPVPVQSKDKNSLHQLPASRSVWILKAGGVGGGRAGDGGGGRQ